MEESAVVEAAATAKSEAAEEKAERRFGAEPARGLEEPEVQQG